MSNTYNYPPDMPIRRRFSNILLAKDLVLFPAKPLLPRYLRPVVRTMATLSATDPLSLLARFPVKEEAAIGIARNYILDNSHPLYSALLQELAVRFSDSRTLDSGRTQRAPPIGTYPFRT
jgi:hypothetical protein